MFSNTFTGFQPTLEFLGTPSTFKSASNIYSADPDRFYQLQSRVSMQHVDHRIVQLLENISGFVSRLILLMSTEGRLELPVFKFQSRGRRPHSCVRRSIKKLCKSSLLQLQLVCLSVHLHLYFLSQYDLYLSQGISIFLHYICDVECLKRNLKI